MIELAPNNPYGLRLSAPVIAAAGALGYGVEYGRAIDLQLLGAIVTRSTSLQPRRGTPQLIETPGGLLYTGGDVNPGLRYVLERCAPVWAGWDVPVIVSVGGASAEQCADVAAHLEGVEGVAGIELNLARFREQPGEAVALLRAATQLPLLVKLPLDASDPLALAQAAVAAGADTLALAGPAQGLYIDPASGERVEGWLCGPALRPLALRLVAALAPAAGVPLIGGGGIATADDARQFLQVGAAAVSVGAALLADPRAAGRIAVELGG
jgi:dihydroorotate dehydrogenase (NAD+) catalytic subunit